MTLADYITALQGLRERVGGEIEVEKLLPNNGRAPAPSPRLSHRKLPTKREKYPRFWNPNTMCSSYKGERVVEI